MLTAAPLRALPEPSFSQTAPPTLPSLLIAQHTEPAPDSGPFHLLLPLSKILFLKCSFISYLYSLALTTQSYEET